MSKIGMVCHRYYPDIGGVETHVREISERLAGCGFDIEVICTDPGGKYQEHEIYNGVSIKRFKAFAPDNAIFFAPQIYFYLKKKDFDIVHAHNYHALPAFFASIAAGGRFFFSPYYHGGSGSTLRNLLLAPYQRIGVTIFEKAEKVVCLSNHEMKLIENDFHVPSSKLIKIPSGLNIQEFKDIKKIIREKKTILYAGRLESYKGLQYVIETMPLLPEFRLTVIGEGNYEERLREQAQELHVNDRIDWLKHIERKELLSHFKSADVFINLSTFESYGITVAEALACGTPCIVSNESALEDFVDGEGCVGIGHPIDKKELASIIKSRKKINPRQLPDWDEVITDLVGIYSIERGRK